MADKKRVLALVSGLSIGIATIAAAAAIMCALAAGREKT